MNNSNIPGMRAYLVGGAVRDRLLGLTESDRDWLVTGVTPQQLLDSGYHRVGQDFSVFLHPRSQEEYALPRAGGANCNQEAQVREDLAARDLTINAIALSPEGRYIDPLNGRQDLQARLLRHTPAFADDPIRILRLARLRAKLSQFDFRIAKETHRLINHLISDGALENMVAERVWSEIQRGLEGAQPALFFRTLQDLGALQPILPELSNLFGVPQPPRHHPEIDTGVHSLMVLQMATKLSPDPETRWAALLHDLGKGTTPKTEWPSHHGHEQRGAHMVEQRCRALRVPQRYLQLAKLVAEYHTHCHRALELKPGTLLNLLMAVDALRRPQRLNAFLIACEADARGRSGFEHNPYPQADYIRAACQAATSVDSGAVASTARGAQQIPQLLFQARCKAISRLKKAGVLNSHDPKASSGSTFTGC